MKTSLVALALAIAVALAWTLAGDPGEQANVPRPSPVPEAEWEGTSAEVDLIGLVQETGAEAPTGRTEVVEGLPEDSAALASDAALEAATAGKLEVLAVARETGAPLPGVSIYASADDGTQVEWIERRAEGTSPVTDEEGRASFFVPAGTHIRLWTTAPASGATIRRELDSFQASEERTVHLNFPTQPDTHLVGRVVEAGSGAPVAGARVRFLSDFEIADEVDTDTGSAVRSGPEGWFEMPLATWSRQHGRVDAKGFGPRLFRPERGHEVRERALIVELQRGATLRGLIVGTPGFGDLRVRVDAEGHDLADRNGNMFSGLGSARRETSVAQDGTWELTDLPPGAGLRVELWRDEARVRSEPERIRLDPGEERSLEWRLGGGTTLRGRAMIVDTGEPLTSHSIWLVGAAEARGAFNSSMDPVASTTTDEEGSFTFADVAPGAWGVGPAPARRAWKQPEEGDVASVSTRVVIPEGAAVVEVELRLYRGLFIEGEILGVDGARVESGFVQGFAVDSEFWNIQQAVSGEFRLGPLVPGSYDLLAGGMADTAQSEPVRARAGDVGVVVRLRAGGSIQGKLVDAASGEPIRGAVKVIPEVDNKQGWTTLLADADGRFRVDGLMTGTYRVIGISGDLVGRVEGVVLDAKQVVRDLEVQLAPGAVLLVTYTGVSKGVYFLVMSGNTPIHAEKIEPGRTSRGVYTAERLVVVLKIPSADGEDRSSERTVDLVVGEETKVEFGDE